MRVLQWAAVLASVAASSMVLAQAPAGATGQCKDGTYTTAAKKWQACSGHTGVKSWFADAKAGAPATAAAPAAAAAPATAATPASPAAPASKAAAAKSAATPARTSPAPGGGPGMVWVNTSTNVYHCPGGKFYGLTKDGKYMAEADAKKAGARPDHNQPCTK